MFQLNNAIDHETNPNKALCFKFDLKCEFTFEQSLLICLFYYLMSCLKISQYSYSLRHRVTTFATIVFERAAPFRINLQTT